MYPNLIKGTAAKSWSRQYLLAGLISVLVVAVIVLGGCIQITPSPAPAAETPPSAPATEMPPSVPTTVVEPTIGSVPQDWYCSDDEPYGTYEELDGTKWGVVGYTDEEDYDAVQVFYGDIPQELKGKEDDGDALIGRAIVESVTFEPEETGTMTVAGELAGMAKAYDSSLDIYEMEIVFVKGATCIDIYAVYDATSEDEAEVMSLINSIGW